MNTIRKQAGFTLIELMIVIAILAILLAIAIPAYQNYTIRANVSECINLASSPKLAVAETAIANGELATDIASADDAGYDGSATEFCGDITIASGVITVPVDAATGTTGNLTFTPTHASPEDNVEWECDTDLDTRYVPAGCRGS